QGRELLVRRDDSGDQVGLAARDELEAIDAVSGQPKLPDGRVDDPGVRHRQRGFDRVELVRGLELQRGVSHAAALQIDDPLRARVRLTENNEPDDAEQDEQRGEHAEHREELQLDPGRDPGECANERIERPYGVNSFRSWRMYARSVPW